MASEREGGQHDPNHRVLQGSNMRDINDVVTYTPRCPEYFYDITYGYAYWWDCGDSCPGGSYVNASCACACQPAPMVIINGTPVVLSSAPTGRPTGAWEYPTKYGQRPVIAPTQAPLIDYLALYNESVRTATKRTEGDNHSNVSIQGNWSSGTNDDMSGTAVALIVTGAIVAFIGLVSMIAVGAYYRIYYGPNAGKDKVGFDGEIIEVETPRQKPKKAKKEPPPPSFVQGPDIQVHLMLPLTGTEVLTATLFGLDEVQASRAEEKLQSAGVPVAASAFKRERCDPSASMRASASPNRRSLAQAKKGRLDTSEKYLPSFSLPNFVLEPPGSQRIDAQPGSATTHGWSHTA